MADIVNLANSHKLPRGQTSRQSSRELRRNSSKDSIAILRAAMKHTLFVTSPPSGRIVKAYADNVLMLSTFMFAFSALHGGTHDRESLSEADREWSEFCESTNRSIPQICPEPFVPPSEQLALYTMSTYVVLGTGLLIAVISYLAILLSEIDEDTTPHQLLRWWRFYQWPMHLAFVMLIVGIVLYGFTMELTARIIYVNTHQTLAVERHVVHNILLFQSTFFLVGAVIIYMVAAHFFLSRSKKEDIQSILLEELAQNRRSERGVDEKPAASNQHGSGQSVPEQV